MDENIVPPVSVVVITRNRPEDLAVCLPSVLAQDFTDFEVVVVDQSTGVESAELVGRLAATDSRIRHQPDAGKGAARARNIGAAVTSGEIVVFTDDDIEASPDWLRTLVGTLCADPEAGMAYGRVNPAPHDPHDGFIIGFTPKRPARLHGRLSKLRDHGISASVAIRREVLVATRGFDEMLGPGGYFPCAEDFDLAYRVLAHGYAILHVPESSVVHHGLRPWGAGSALVRATYIAIGAAYMKHVRMGDLVGLALLMHEVWLALANIIAHAMRLKGPLGIGRLGGLLLGVVRSYELEIGSRYAVYLPRTGLSVKGSSPQMRVLRDTHDGESHRDSHLPQLFEPSCD
jgi:GT2 family glycosyltransferase